jgi:hypothetical protein
MAEQKASQRTPGVPYTTKNGDTFYVDAFWAMAIEDKKPLDSLLTLSESDLATQLKELSLTDVMRSAYTFADIMFTNPPQFRDSDAFSKRFIEWYYVSLSPNIVSWQLEHPKANRLLRKISVVIMDCTLSVLNKEKLSSKDVFRTKHHLKNFKLSKYPQYTNPVMQCIPDTNSTAPHYHY